MDKKILERASYDTDNAKLEAAIADYTASNNDIRKLEGLIKIFKGAQVLVPVAFPKQVKVTVLEKMLRGEPLGKDESFPLFPHHHVRPEGEQVCPGVYFQGQGAGDKGVPLYDPRAGGAGDPERLK